MTTKVRSGAGAVLILGIVYSALGSVFTFLGLGFLFALPGELRMIGMIFFGIGSLFLILGIVFLALRVRRKKRAERLVAEGRYIWGEVVDCVPNLSVTINHRHPYILKALYVDSQGNHHVFSSESLRIVRTPNLIGRKVKIYYQEGFRHYYMDAEPILPTVIEH